MISGHKALHAALRLRSENGSFTEAVETHIITLRLKVDKKDAAGFECAPASMQHAGPRKCRPQTPPATPAQRTPPSRAIPANGAKTALS